MYSNNEFSPLATRMRPRNLSEFIGQKHLLASGKPLFQAIQHGKLHSMILWGPPGSGKTTLATILANAANANVETLSAVLAGVKEIRDVVQLARQAQEQHRATILFVDEVHRFNKAQQDAFLPHVEQGTITLIGATTENPSFHLNNALLSRCRTYVLQRLDESELLAVLRQALMDKERGYGQYDIHLSDAKLSQILHFADGDARQSLNTLELLLDLAKPVAGHYEIDDAALREVLAHSLRRFDRGGDYFYDQISALHKSVRGSNPDAALYWFSRMLDGGCDPHYLARRLVRIACEDIGNADPRALSLSLDAWEAFDRLGSPEGELALAQAVIYLACAAKSNAVYVAAKHAMQAAKEHGSLQVPMHLRNAPTRLMKDLDYGKEYRYAHDEPDAFAAGVIYFPESLEGHEYYQPVERGVEAKIKEKLEHLRRLDKQAKGHREP